MTNKTDTNKLAGSAELAANQLATAMRDQAVASLEEAKGEDLRVLDVRELTDVTDYMVLATGTSDRHVKALAERVREDMRKAGWRPIGVEGETDQEWVLLDFVDIVVHVMRHRTRALYDLESLWDENLGELLKAQREGGSA